MTGGRIANPSHKPVFRPTEREFRRQHKLICAALQAPLALWRKSTRKPSANQRANHFPKDVRYIRNGAQTILPAAHIILPGRANHFCQLRKPFCLEAQTILIVSFAGSIAVAGLVFGEAWTRSQKGAWCEPCRQGDLSPRSQRAWLIVVAPRGQALVAAGRMAQRAGCQTSSHGDKPRGDVRNFRNAHRV